MALFNEETISLLDEGSSLTLKKALEIIDLDARVVLAVGDAYVFCEVAGLMTGIGPNEEAHIILEECVPASAPDREWRRWSFRLSDGHVTPIPGDGHDKMRLESTDAYKQHVERHTALNDGKIVDVREQFIVERRHYRRDTNGIERIYYLSDSPLRNSPLFFSSRRDEAFVIGSKEEADLAVQRCGEKENCWAAEHEDVLYCAVRR